MNNNTPLNLNGINFDIEASMEKGVYTNLVLMVHRDTEFVFDFLFLQPQAPKAKVVARVVTSPLHVKRMVAAMAGQLRDYEARYGEVRDSNPPQPPGPLS